MPEDKFEQLAQMFSRSFARLEAVVAGKIDTLDAKIDAVSARLEHKIEAVAIAQLSEGVAIREDIKAMRRENFEEFDGISERFDKAETYEHRIKVLEDRVLG
jgi:hypothetical protein